MALDRVEAFRLACQDARSQQQVSLARISALNSRCAHLRRHGLEADVAAAAAAIEGGESGERLERLLQSLPLTTFNESFRPLADAAVQAAERGDEAGYAAAVAELTGARPNAFCSTSGSSGGCKYIPTPDFLLMEAVQAYTVVEDAFFAAFPADPPKKEVLLRHPVPVRTLANGVTVAPFSATLMKMQAAERENDPIVVEDLTSPLCVWAAGHGHTAAYLHWLFALSQRTSVVGISDAFAGSLTLACNVLLEYQAELLADLAAGIPGAAAWGPAPLAAHTQPLAAPPPEIQSELDSSLQPNPELAGELRKAFVGGRPGLLERLFPRLQAIRCIATGAMQKFVPLIRELAPHTAIISPCYLATEGCFGVASELVEYASLLAKGGNAPQQQQYHQQGAGAGGFKAFSKEPPERASFILRPDCSAFLEFIPQGGCAAGGGDHYETLRLHELREGESYELVVTNTQGLWRCRMGDVLKCVGHFGTAPKVVIEGRSNQELSVVGEHTPEATLVAAVRAFAEAELPRGGLSLKEWASRECIHGGAASGGGVTAGHYIFYMEFAEEEEAGAQQLPSLAACATALEVALVKQGGNYPLARVHDGRLSGLELRRVRPGAFAALRELAVAQGAAPQQYKSPVVLGKPEQVQLMDGEVVEAATAPDKLP